MSLKLTSQAFVHQGDIPSLYTCDGKDVSPPLAWSGIPTGTQSLVLIVDDPDAPDPANPRMTWVHWILFNMPSTVTELQEGIPPTDLPEGTGQGLNDWHRTGYGGPCPPVGRHRYFFKLYALDIVLAEKRTPGKAQLEKLMQDHILAQSELIGLYERKR